MTVEDPISGRKTSLISGHESLVEKKRDTPEQHSELITSRLQTHSESLILDDSTQGLLVKQPLLVETTPIPSISAESVICKVSPHMKTTVQEESISLNAPLSLVDTESVTRKASQPEIKLVKEKLPLKNTPEFTTLLSFKCTESATRGVSQTTVQEKRKSQNSPKLMNPTDRKTIKAKTRVKKTDSDVIDTKMDKFKFQSIVNDIRKKQIEETKQKEYNESVHKPKVMDEPSSVPPDTFLSLIQELRQGSTALKFPVQVKRTKKVIGEKSEGPFLCDFCPHKTFISKNKLEAHRRAVHVENGDFVCSVCGKCMKTKYILKEHELKHKEDRSFVCKTCGKTFTSPGNLRVHQRGVHDKVKKHCCHICGYQTFGVGYLKTHLRRHNQERTHFCHLCTKAFYTNYHLKKHILTHC